MKTAHRWGHRLITWLGMDAAGELGQLLHAGRHSLLLSRRRAATLVMRTRAAALLLALTTLAFMGLDAVVFPRELFASLAAARLVAAAALVLLAVWLRDGRRLSGAHTGLLLLFGIPTALLFVANNLLAQQPLVGAAASVSGVYSLMPFVMAAAISIFPLAWFEALALGLMVMAVELATVAAQSPHGGLLNGSGALWSALLVTLMSALAGMNQVGLMAAIIAQATHDPLTGGYVRRNGEELLGMYYSLALRRQQPLSVLFMDLDRFKAINDSFGHEAGDAILAQAGAAFKAALRDSDLLLRWGGEEFVIVLPDTDTAQAQAFVERLVAVGLGQRPDGTPLTASMGLASFPHDGVASWPALVQLADARMYQAKQAGRNRWVGPTPAPHAGAGQGAGATITNVIGE